MECKYSTNDTDLLKTEASKGCNYYLSDLKSECNNGIKSTFETIRLIFHRPVGLVELLILYARVQFYMHRASDYHLISKTGLEKY